MDISKLFHTLRVKPRAKKLKEKYAKSNDIYDLCDYLREIKPAKTIQVIYVGECAPGFKMVEFKIITEKDKFTYRSDQKIIDESIKHNDVGRIQYKMYQVFEKSLEKA